MDVESLLPFAFFGFFVFVVGLVFVLGRRQAGRARANLTRLGGTLGLQTIEGKKSPIFGPGMPTLRGQIRGRDVRVHAYTTGSGKNRTQWCAISCDVRNPRGLSLRISGENLITRVGRALGVDDVTVGDPVFDGMFYVKSSDPDFVSVALIPEVRARLMEAWKTGARGSIAADGTQVKYAETGSFGSDRMCARFDALMPVVLDVCEIVETHGL